MFPLQVCDRRGLEEGRHSSKSGAPMSTQRAAIILAAGEGTRMRSATPKVLHAVGGRAMIDWTLAAAGALGCARTIVVVSPTGQAVAAHVARQGADTAIQERPLGTGHAVRAAETALSGFEGDVVVLFGDTPLVRPERIADMFALRAAKGGLVVLGFEPADPGAYGRLVVDAAGAVAQIVEARDATREQLAVRLCNSGVLVGEARMLFQFLSMVRNDNAKGEYYLTSIVGLARSAGFATHVVRAEEAEVLGVNSRAELAAAEAAFQARARAAALEAGVTLTDPASVYFAHDTVVEPDVVIEPHVVFGPGVRIARGARVNAFSHITQAEIGPDCIVGPFARLRPGAKLGARAHIGNFVEVKNVSEDAKANHRAYLGDGEVGARANIGAGAIFCNYDGFDKHRTKVGDDAFIGSNSALVAPVSVGARAYTASGSVITTDVPEGALGVGRARQRDVAGWADAFRARKRREKGLPE
jgi:bifunctional UDP-N-acetylglucosamine pyrophosphorylase/glucosamine-1-phosphate N-acetyltransferase